MRPLLAGTRGGDAAVPGGEPSGELLKVLMGASGVTGDTMPFGDRLMKPAPRCGATGGSTVESERRVESQSRCGNSDSMLSTGDERKAGEASCGGMVGRCWVLKGRGERRGAAGLASAGS